MEALKFKTNLKCDGCVSKITPSLNEMQGVKTWGVNLNDIDRVLTVSGEQIDEKAVVSALEKNGYTAQKL